MKKYVFVTMNIGGINGAEQYIYNKMNFLKDQGYEVLIFSGRPEKILIDKFRQFKELINPALRFFPYALSKKEREKTIRWMLAQINCQQDDECIIESSNVTSALWGELIASMVHCKHLAILMQEKNNYDADMRKFLRHKYDSHELAGILENSVCHMLADPQLQTRPDTRVRAFCTNVVQDCEDKFSGQLNPDATVTIGSIGRLEKDYVKPLIQQLVDYFKKQEDKKFNLVLIGGCANQHNLKNIKKSISQCKNVCLLLTDNLYPIPRTLVNNVNVFVSAAGSAKATYYQMRPTIKIDHITAAPMGIMGYDVFVEENASKIQNSTDRSLHECIDLALDPSTDIQVSADYEKMYIDNMQTEFARHLSFGEKGEASNYYDVLAVRYHSPLYIACAFVCKQFGVKFAYQILELLRKAVRGG